MKSQNISLLATTNHNRQIGKSNNWHEDHGKKRTTRIEAKLQRAVDLYGGNAGGMVSVSPPQVMKATLFAAAAFSVLMPSAHARQMGRGDRRIPMSMEVIAHANSSAYLANPPHMLKQAHTGQSAKPLIAQNLSLLANQRSADTPRHVRQIADATHNAAQLNDTAAISSDTLPSNITTTLAPIATDTSLVALRLAKTPTVTAPSISFADAERTLMSRLPNYFAAFLKNSHPLRTDIHSLQSALKVYLQKSKAHGKHGALFEHDHALINHLAHMLGLEQPLAIAHTENPNLTAQHTNLRPYVKVLARNLALTLTQKIDFSTLHPKDAMTKYDGHCFVGVNHGYSLYKTVIEAKQQIQHFLKLKIQEHFNITPAQADLLAQLLLPPELAVLRENDAAIKHMKYGDTHWATLYIGTRVALNRHLDPTTYSASELMYLGHTFMREQPDDHQLSSHPLREHIPFSTEAILLMARAREFINDAMLETQTTEDVSRVLDQFISVAFRPQIAEAQARIDLSTTQPMTRRNFAIKTMLKHGIDDPDEEITVRRSAHTRDGEIEHSPEQKSLLECYLEQHVTGLGYNSKFPLIAQRYHLPNLASAYRNHFDETQKTIEQYLANFLKAHLQLRLAEELENPSTTLTLKAMKMQYTPDFLNEQHHPIGEEVIGKGVMFIEVNNDAAGIQHFVFINKEEAQGLQPLPAKMNATTWAKNAHHLEKIFTPAERDHGIADHNYQTTLHETVLTSNTGVELWAFANAIAIAIAKHYGKNYIASLYEEYFQPSARERAHDIARSIVVPFYDLPATIRNWSEMTLTQKQDAITSYGVEILGFIPAISKGFTLAKTMGKLSSFSVRATVEETSRAVASIAKETIKLPKQGFKFTYELGDAFMPIPVPGGKIKTHAHRYKEQRRIAAELKPYPNLADPFTATVRHKVRLENGYWAANDPAQIVTKNAVSTYAVEGRPYRAALLDGQPILFKADTTDASRSFVRVNPLTDQVEGLPILMHISTENKVYANEKTAHALLRDYRISHDQPGMSLNHQLADETGARLTYRENIHGYNAIRIGDHYHGPFYRITRDDNALFHIVHRLDQKKTMPVEVIDGKWQLIFNAMPEEFNTLKVTQIRSWKHPLTGDELTVTRLADENGVVALKHDGGKYREIDWANGKPICSDQRCVYKQADSIFTHHGLKGGMQNVGDDVFELAAESMADDTFELASESMPIQPYTDNEKQAMRIQTPYQTNSNQLGSYQRANNGKYPLRDELDRPIRIKSLNSKSAATDSGKLYSSTDVKPYIKFEGYEDVAKRYEEKLQLRQFTEADVKIPGERALVGQSMVVANRRIAKGECLGVYGGNVLPEKYRSTTRDTFYTRIGGELKWRQGQLQPTDVVLDGNNIISRINTNIEYNDAGKAIRQAPGGYNVEIAEFKIYVDKPSTIEGNPPVREIYDLQALFATQDIPTGIELRLNYHYSEDIIQRKFS